MRVGSDEPFNLLRMMTKCSTHQLACDFDVPLNALRRPRQQPEHNFLRRRTWENWMILLDKRGAAPRPDIVREIANLLLEDRRIDPSRSAWNRSIALNNLWTSPCLSSGTWYTPWHRCCRRLAVWPSYTWMSVSLGILYATRGMNLAHMYTIYRLHNCLCMANWWLDNKPWYTQL